ncbi:MAG TPA: O-antigen ligase family protein [Terriglobia bacterium]|nr:O-antigen ligase family protein [Terriglobia bacterium]
MTSKRGFLESACAELPAPAWARWASVFFSLSVLTFLVSLTISQVFLTLAGCAYAVHVVRTQRLPALPPVKLPLALFCLFSVISIFWAENPAVGGFAVRKLVLFLILLMAINLVTSTRHLKFLYQGLFVESGLVGGLAAFQFVLQYRVTERLHPGQVYIYMRAERIHGLMGHWMNFGGQQMLVFLALFGFLLLDRHVAPGFNPARGPSGMRAGTLKGGLQFSRGKMAWWLVWAVVAISVVLNFSRGIWLGSFIASIYLIGRWQARWLWTLPVLLLVGYWVSPGLIRKRLDSVRHPSSDPSIAIRFEMWQVGWRMIQRHPLVGVGPNNIPEVYTLYLPPGKSPMVGYREHLHDDYLQLAAERGLPCLAAWLWLMIAFGRHALRVRRKLIRNPSEAGCAWVPDAALACLLAFATEGFFEYNFGASPVLMVFLFMVSTPFVVERQGKESGVRSQESEGGS